jgi:hypothetical protein
MSDPQLDLFVNPPAIGDGPNSNSLRVTIVAVELITGRPVADRPIEGQIADAQRDTYDYLWSMWYDQP